VLLAGLAILALAGSPMPGLALHAVSSGNSGRADRLLRAVADLGSAGTLRSASTASK